MHITIIIGLSKQERSQDSVSIQYYDNKGLIEPQLTYQVYQPHIIQYTGTMQQQQEFLCQKSQIQDKPANRHQNLSETSQIGGTYLQSTETRKTPEVFPFKKLGQNQNQQTDSPQALLVNRLGSGRKPNRPWTIEQETLLDSLHEEWRGKWADIAKGFPNRTVSELKNHYYSRLRLSVRHINKISRQGLASTSPLVKDFMISRLVAAVHQNIQDSQDNPVQPEWQKACSRVIKRVFRFRYIKSDIQQESIDIVRQIQEIIETFGATKQNAKIKTSLLVAMADEREGIKNDPEINEPLSISKGPKVTTGPQQGLLSLRVTASEAGTESDSRFELIEKSPIILGKCPFSSLPQHLIQNLDCNLCSQFQMLFDAQPRLWDLDWSLNE